MNLEQQVCSRELGERLHKLGVPHDGPFSWVKQSRGYKLRYRGSKRVGLEHALAMVSGVPAWNVAELDEHLMKTDWAVIAQHDGHWVFRRKKNTTLEYGMIGGTGMGPMKNGADRRASLLIYLIENKLIEV